VNDGYDRYRNSSSFAVATAGRGGAGGCAGAATRGAGTAGAGAIAGAAAGEATAAGGAGDDGTCGAIFGPAGGSEGVAVRDATDGDAVAPALAGGGDGVTSEREGPEGAGVDAGTGRIRGNTCVMKPRGAIQRPSLSTRTGASRTTGVPFTVTRAQLRVNVTRCPGVRRNACVLSDVASSREFTLSATRLSSTYGRPS
jgi:hypothetical protein